MLYQLNIILNYSQGLDKADPLAQQKKRFAETEQ